MAKWFVRVTRARTGRGKRYYTFKMTIPKAVVRALGLEHGDPLEVSLLPDGSGFRVRVVRDDVPGSV